MAKPVALDVGDTGSETSSIKTDTSPPHEKRPKFPDPHQPGVYSDGGQGSEKENIVQNIPHGQAPPGGGRGDGRALNRSGSQLRRQYSLSDGIGHRGTTPDGIGHHGTTPDGIGHRGTTPDGIGHRGTTPDGIGHRGTTPDGIGPRGPTPDGIGPHGAPGSSEHDARDRHRQHERNNHQRESRDTSRSRTAADQTEQRNKDNNRHNQQQSDRHNQQQSDRYADENRHSDKRHHDGVTPEDRGLRDMDIHDHKHSATANERPGYPSSGETPVVNITEEPRPHERPVSRERGTHDESRRRDESRHRYVWHCVNFTYTVFILY